MISNLRSALRATFTGWRKRRAARDQHAILQRVDAYTREFNRAVKRAIELTKEDARRAADDEPRPDLIPHPLTHQRRPVNPARYPGAVSLDDAARRLIKDEDDAVLDIVGDEDTGQLPRHLLLASQVQR